MPKTVFTGEHLLLVELLKTARRKAGLTQTELAVKLGRDQSHISLIEGGQRRVDTLEFITLMRALDVDPLAGFIDLLSKLPADFQA
jgi:transcriptional regulator with XRE-family HTH domain